MAPEVVHEASPVVDQGITPEIVPEAFLASVSEPVSELMPEATPHTDQVQLAQFPGFFPNEGYATENVDEESGLIDTTVLNEGYGTNLDEEAELFDGLLNNTLPVAVVPEAPPKICVPKKDYIAYSQKYYLMDLFEKFKISPREYLVSKGQRPEVASRECLWTGVSCKDGVVTRLSLSESQCEFKFVNLSCLHADTDLCHAICS